MIWSMADLKKAQGLREHVTGPFGSVRPGRLGRGMEEHMQQRFIKLAEAAELVVHPDDIVVEIDEPIIASDSTLAWPDFYSIVTARWVPQGRGIVFKGMGEPADSMFGYYNGLNDVFSDGDTITIELDSRPWGGPLHKVPTVLRGWSEEERAWVYGPKPGFSEESGDVVGNSNVTLSWTLGR